MKNFIRKFLGLFSPSWTAEKRPVAFVAGGGGGATETERREAWRTFFRGKRERLAIFLAFFAFPALPVCITLAALHVVQEPHWTFTVFAWTLCAFFTLLQFVVELTVAFAKFHGFLGKVSLFRSAALQCADHPLFPAGWKRVVHGMLVTFGLLCGLALVAALYIVIIWQLKKNGLA